MMSMIDILVYASSYNNRVIAEDDHVNTLW